LLALCAAGGARSAQDPPASAPVLLSSADDSPADEARAAELLARMRALPETAVEQRIELGRAALDALGTASTGELAMTVRLRLGEACMDGQRHEEAVVELARAAELATARGAEGTLLLARYYIAFSCVQTGDFARVITSAREAAELARRGGRSDLEFGAVNLLGAAHERAGERDLALEAWTRCVQLAEARGDAASLYTVLNNLGVLRMNAGQLDGARACFERARDIARAAGDGLALAATLANLGDLASLGERYHEAVELHEEALALRAAAGVDSAVALSLSSIGALRVALGDAAGAVPLLQQALETQRAAGQTPGMVSTLRRLSLAHAALDRPAEALRAASEALELSEAIQAKSQRVEVLRALSEAQLAAGDPLAAFAALREAFELARELAELERLSSFATKNAELGLHERERQIDILQREAALQQSRGERERLLRWALAGGALALLLVALLGWSRYRNKRRAHEALARASEMELRLARAHKLESLGLISGGLAHDFNNLLTGILGHAELARGAPPGATRATGHLDEIVRISRRAALLAEELLTFSGRSIPRRESIDLAALIERTARLVRVAFPGRRIELDLSPEVPALAADPAQIERVLLNLLKNAAEAAGDAGRVSVRTRHHASAASSASNGALGAPPVESCVDIVVEDSGPGLADGVREHLFEPFYTTKPDGKGLGLSTVYGIVHGHGGEVHVASDPGRGATFTVCLPVRELAAAELAPVPALPAAPHDSPAALVVDDDPAVRAATSGLLALLGYRAQTAADGRSALEAVERAETQFAFVLLDLSMPGMGGYEVLLRVRALRPELPVILMTGYDRQGRIDELCRTHGVVLLRKPFDSKELELAIRTGTARWGAPQAQT